MNYHLISTYTIRMPFAQVCHFSILERSPNFTSMHLDQPMGPVVAAAGGEAWALCYLMRRFVVRDTGILVGVEGNG